MVAGVHMVITILGRTHTEVVVEQALEPGIPTLPIPDAGGDSKDLLKKHNKRIAVSFEEPSKSASLTSPTQYVTIRRRQLVRLLI